jgi:hypothetical protein
MLTSLGRGGAKRQVIALAERMAVRGHQVVLIVLKRAKRMNGHLARSDQAWNAQIPCKLLFRTFGRTSLSAAPLQPCSPRFTTPMKVDGGVPRSTASQTVSRSIPRRVSQSVANRFVKIGAVPQIKCSVTNGIEPAEFTPVPNRRIDVRGQLNAGDDFICAFDSVVS